jgi:CubicO group peptidase (beta-lactamase class C family)
MQRLTAINENKHPVLQKRKSKKIKFAGFAEKYITDYSKPNKKSYKCDIARLKSLMAYFGDFYINFTCQANFSMNGDGQPEDISSYPRNAHDSMLWTTGALYSTAEDVVRYSRALFNCELFTRDSLEQMLDYVPYPYNPALGYGFGILIIPDFIPNIQALGHDGTVYGFKARWVYLPDYDVHIAVLLNEDNYDCLTAITAGLARVVLNHH